MQEFFSISLLIFLAAVSPGPDFALVTKNSLIYSRRAGLYTALGVSLSLLIHAVYCILGLAIIIAHSLLLFKWIKYLGAAYLIFLGIKALLAQRDGNFIQVNAAEESWTGFAVFREGFFCNLLNPKAIMFLLAFFTLILKPGHSLVMEIFYGIEISLIHMIWFSLLTYLLTHGSIKDYLSRIQFYIVKAMGALLVLFGCRIAMLNERIL